jgi:hypothetical protein
MNHSPHTSESDDPEYWRPIVEQRLRDFENVRRFVEEHKDTIPAHRRRQIFQEGRSVLRQAAEFGFLGGWSMQEIKDRVEPTAGWAGVLQQATYVMREAIGITYPQLYSRLPKLGEPDPGVGR